MRVVNIELGKNKCTLLESYFGKVIINFNGKKVLHFPAWSLKTEKEFFIKEERYNIKRKYRFWSDYVHHIIFQNGKPIFSTYERSSDLISSMLTIAVLILLAYTNPSKDKHQAYVFKEKPISEKLSDLILKTNSHYLNFILFSTYIEKDGYITFGVLGKIFVFKDQ